MREKTTFGFKFHGDEVRDGTIQVEDFAATASAIGTLVREANQTLNAGRAMAAVRVKADSFYAGSFEATLEVALLIADHAGRFIGNDGLKTSEQLLEALGFWNKAAPAGGLGVGLLGLLKWLRGRPPKEMITNRAGVTQVVAHDGANIKIDESVNILFSDPALPQAVNNVIRTLKRRGLDSLEFFGADEREARPVTITKRDAENIERIAKQRGRHSRREMNVREYETWLRVVSITFEGRSMWQFKEDGKRVKAHIEDKMFLNRVQHGRVRFRSGTSLKVLVKTVTTRTHSGTSRTRRSILKVLDVEDRTIRRQLGFDESL